MSGTQPSLSHTNAVRLNKLSLPSLRVPSAKLILLISALLICASARAQVSLNPVALIRLSRVSLIISEHRSAVLSIKMATTHSSGMG